MCLKGAHLSLEGPLFALLTPFAKDLSVDYEALGAYLDFLAGKGVRNVLCNGTTGEFASLSNAERREVVEFVRTRWSGTLVNHVSATCQEEAIGLIKHTAEGGHADAVLVLPPYYFCHPPPAGVERWLEGVVAACAMPIFLYNFPAHTQATIDDAMYRRLAAGAPGVLCGIKDSSGSLEVAHTFKNAAPGLQVYVGNDRAATQVLQSGLDGSVTGASSPCPEALVGLYMGGPGDASNGHQKVLDAWSDIRDKLACQEVAATKVAVSERVPGFGTWVRPPLAPASAADEGLVRAWTLGLR